MHIVERYPKSTQAAFGRAITFWPRSIELLDQLGLFTTLIQTAFVCRRSVTFDSEGQRVNRVSYKIFKGRISILQ